MYLLLFYLLVKANAKRRAWSAQRYDKVLNMLHQIAVQKSMKKTNEQYYFLRQYEIFEVNGIKTLIKKRESESAPIKFILPMEQFYTKLLECHLATDHGSRAEMQLALKPNFSIPCSVIEIFLKCCKLCSEKEEVPKKRVYRVKKTRRRKNKNVYA